MDPEQFRQFLDVVKVSLQNISIQPQPSTHGTVSAQPYILNFEKFDKQKEKFTQYIERFQNFAQLKGISEDKALLKQTLLNCIGSETYQTLKSLSAPKSIQDVTFDEIIEKLRKHLSPPPNQLLEQHRFLSRIQSDAESISDYVTALRSHLENSDFKCTCGGSIANQFLRAQFIRGIKSSTIREKLLYEANLDFDKAVTMALSMENSEIDNLEIKNGISNGSSSHVNKVFKTHHSRSSSHQNGDGRSNSKSRARYQGNRSNQRYHHRSSSQGSYRKPKRKIDYEKLGIADLCIRCGRNNHRASECRTNQSSLKCNACGNKGHVSKVCIKSLLSQSVKSIEDNEVVNFNDIVNFESPYDCHILSSVDLLDPFGDEHRDSGKYFAKVLINGTETQFEVDSGCGYTLLPETDFQKLKSSVKLFPARQNFKSYDHGIIKPIGYAKAFVTFNNVTAHVPFYVVPSHLSPILGRSWIRRFKINLNELDNFNVLSNDECNSNEPLPSVNRVTIHDIQKQFPEICQQTVGKIPDILCSLPLKSDAKPKFMKARDPAYAIKHAVDNELDELEKQGIITQTNTSQWGSPLVPVPKPENKVRLCVDYKLSVNPKLDDYHYPIPRIEELLSQLKDSNVYCKIDLFKAYLHVEMDDESKKIQTISTHRGTFLMNRLSLGIKTAPSQFHQILGRILANLKGVIWYFDDIIVHGKNYSDCLNNLLALLKRLQENNLHINLQKCLLFKNAIAYLGYIIQGRKIFKDPRKTSAIVDAKRPTNHKELKQFLGLVTYYSRFIPNTSTLTAPLRQLLTKNHPFKWSCECEKAFLELKSQIASDRVLVSYDVNLPVTVACDASPWGLGAVISHIIDGVEKPIMFVSRSLSPAEKHYSQLDREALGIVFALDKFFMYLYGRKFVLLTDNKPLARIFGHNKKLPPMTAARLLRYAAYLSTFNYEVKHRTSEENANADYLSRFPVSDVSPAGNQPSLDFELSECQDETIHQISSDSITSSDIVSATAADAELSGIIAKLRSDADEPLSLEFTIGRGMLFRGDRIYVPKILRDKILQELHLTHPGISKMKRLARRYVYWPSIDSDIEKLVKSCKNCTLNQTSPKKAPAHKWEIPDKNFDRVHIDHAGPRNGYYFIILVDAKSKWPEIRIERKAPTTISTINLLEEIFTSHGYPQTLVSDNASIFSEKNETFKNYCKARGIFHCFTAPNKPSTNGLAEKYVQILKSKLQKMEGEPGNVEAKVQQILLQFRATPLVDGRSPAERYLNRPIRIRLDAIRPFTPKKSVTQTQNFLPVRSFQVGNTVIARTFRGNKPAWDQGVILRKFGRLHYLVRLENNHVFKRHIDQLRSSNLHTTQEKPHTSGKRVTFNESPQINHYSQDFIPDLQPVVKPNQETQEPTSNSQQTLPASIKPTPEM